jgi:hypothetical protein
MSRSKDLAVLIIAYRRSEGIRNLLEICIRNGITRIYIALDGPKNGSPLAEVENSEIRKIIQDTKANSPKVSIITLFRDQNFGCAASVLSACDWVFESEEVLAILEDDCFPNDDFFSFSTRALEVMRSRPDIWLACGTQFVPNNGKTESWSLSRYALIWGWVTTRERWIDISSTLKTRDKLSSFSDRSVWEKIYWLAGSRRAYDGWVDAWDTILVQKMLVNRKFSILPDNTLVTNNGNDQHATHTRNESLWLNANRGKFSGGVESPIYTPEKDLWLLKVFFKISCRHILSTQVTRLRDNFNSSKRPFEPLLVRWEAAEIHRKIHYP